MDVTPFAVAKGRHEKSFSILATLEPYQDVANRELHVTAGTLNDVH